MEYKEFYKNHKFNGVLTSDMVDFITDYQPNNSHFTSNDEIKNISDAFNLRSNSSIEYCMALRNAIVNYYSELMDNEIITDDNGKFKGRTDDYWKYNTAMSSITAVIDNFIYNH